MKRTRVLVLSYAALVLIALAGWHTERLYIGSLAVVPLLFIAYHTTRPTALLTAVISGVLLAALDRDMIPGAMRLLLPAPLDAVILSSTLCAVVLVAEALRHAHQQAEHDVLTRIPNRNYFLKRLNEAIRTAKDGRIAVLFADLDGFKAVNDTSGHAAGDAVLTHAAERLRHVVRSHDVLARIGGDEFAVLLHDFNDKGEVEIIGRHIENAIAQPFHVGDRRFNLGITIGTSFYPDDGRDAETLLRLSDAKMYRLKNAKRSEPKSAL